MVSDEGEGDELLIIIATLATAEVSAGALAKADQNEKFWDEISFCWQCVTCMLLMNLNSNNNSVLMY